MEEADKEIRIVFQKPKPNGYIYIYIYLYKYIDIYLYYTPVNTGSVCAHIFLLAAVPHLHVVLGKRILLSILI